MSATWYCDTCNDSHLGNCPSHFRRDDVDRIIELADWAQRVLDGEELHGLVDDAEGIAEWRDLAARIDALLPP